MFVEPSTLSAQDDPLVERTISASRWATTSPSLVISPNIHDHVLIDATYGHFSCLVKRCVLGKYVVDVLGGYVQNVSASARSEATGP